MNRDKIKVRISDFVELILLNDAQAFGFVKRDSSPNLNAFLNQLIPNLFELRKQRRWLIHDSIESAMEFSADKITQEHVRTYIDTVIDKAYFSDEELNRLEAWVWLRPNRDKIAIFDEIYEVETEVTGMDFSGCIRSFLNEYARLPQYKREMLAFKTELSNAKVSCNTERIMHLTYDDKKYRVVVLDYVYGFLYDQRNFIICYDTRTGKLKSFFLSGISNSYLIRANMHIDDSILDAYREFLESEKFREQETYEIK